MSTELVAGKLYRLWSSVRDPDYQLPVTLRTFLDDDWSDWSCFHVSAGEVVMLLNTEPIFPGNFDVYWSVLFRDRIVWVNTKDGFFTEFEEEECP